MFDFILQNLTLAWVFLVIDISVTITALILLKFTFENHKTFKADLLFFYGKKHSLFKKFEKDSSFLAYNIEHYKRDRETLKEKMDLSYLYTTIPAMIGLFSAILTLMWILSILDPQLDPEKYDDYFKLTALGMSLFSIPCLLSGVFIYRRYRDRYIYLIKKLQNDTIELEARLSKKP